MKDFVLFTVLIALVGSQTSTAQFPTKCMDTASLNSKRCCPDECGSEDGRGVCGSIDFPASIDKLSVRDAWPYYFDHICICNHNFAGYNCSRCKYGYYGVNCSRSKVVERRPISDYSPQEWEDYVNILAMTKSYNSDYMVFLEEPQSSSDPSQLPQASITLYDLFVWQHHYPAKDSENKASKKDYAHESTGFPTWHRQFLLWFEWEVQYMLETKGKEDYYMFRIPYWDWRKDKQSDKNSPFKSNRLGETVNNNGLPQVHGITHSEFLSNWETRCWRKGKNYDICNPEIATGQLQRCPLKESCNSKNEFWPSDEDVQTILSLPEYDTHPYDKTAANSFRNLLEGFKPLSNDDIGFCRENKLCICKHGEDEDFNCTESDSEPQPTDPMVPIQRLLHNSVHIILGLGYFGSDAQNNKSKSGVMADVAASANDPIFLNHHAMVDCIFETWLQKNPNVQYPMSTKIPTGHRYDDYIVPFFPLYKHSDMFTTAENFGYQCIINSDQSNHLYLLALLVLVPIMMIVGIIILCCCCCRKSNKQRAAYKQIPK